MTSLFSSTTLGTTEASRRLDSGPRLKSESIDSISSTHVFTVDKEGMNASNNPASFRGGEGKHELERKDPTEIPVPIVVAREEDWVKTLILPLRSCAKESVDTVDGCESDSRI